eukprot:CAMPEP_0194158058 /NCGR_PEP_ID=MMETSP0152-20130528/74553_1 /TAXON_ID=1049557 /ORGANISM="Thalassiothrix antarctica, Strain L6-D1" /LENGTH=212 /DNA_ID=CAMNT_0038866985 /DNA_START=111 /DNA_END=746 /DNA_ORIENTATION=-
MTATMEKEEKDKSAGRLSKMAEFPFDEAEFDIEEQINTNDIDESDKTDSGLLSNPIITELSSETRKGKEENNTEIKMNEGAKAQIETTTAAAVAAEVIGEKAHFFPPTVISLLSLDICSIFLGSSSVENITDNKNAYSPTTETTVPSPPPPSDMKMTKDKEENNRKEKINEGMKRHKETTAAATATAIAAAAARTKAYLLSPNIISTLSVCW